MRLKDHILSRRTGVDEREFSDDERDLIQFRNKRIYGHRRLRINYTTYDVRRSQDSINPRTRPDIMVLSSNKEDGAHPYWYARVIGIFHCLVRHRGLDGSDGDFQRVEFLWVRWYTDPVNECGWAKKRLPRLRFVQHDKPDAFGFVNPADVIRGIHIIPAFYYGRTSLILPNPSLARACGRDAEVEEDDWEFAYVNM